MTDYADLVKRLRAFRPTDGWPEEYAATVQKSLGDASADAIEALVKERSLSPCSSCMAAEFLTRAEAAEAEIARLRDSLRSVVGSETHNDAYKIARNALDKPLKDG
jgi:hypothetical protein